MTICVILTLYTIPTVPTIYTIPTIPTIYTLFTSGHQTSCTALIHAAGSVMVRLQVWTR